MMATHMRPWQPGGAVRVAFLASLIGGALGQTGRRTLFSYIKAACLCLSVNSLSACPHCSAFLSSLHSLGLGRLNLVPPPSEDFGRFQATSRLTLAPGVALASRHHRPHRAARGLRRRWWTAGGSPTAGRPPGARCAPPGTPNQHTRPGCFVRAGVLSLSFGGRAVGLLPVEPELLRPNARPDRPVRFLRARCARPPGTPKETHQPRRASPGSPRQHASQGFWYELVQPDFGVSGDVGPDAALSLHDGENTRDAPISPCDSRPRPHVGKQRNGSNQSKQRKAWSQLSLAHRTIGVGLLQEPTTPAL